MMGVKMSWKKPKSIRDKLAEDDVEMVDANHEEFHAYKSTAPVPGAALGVIHNMVVYLANEHKDELLQLMPCNEGAGEFFTWLEKESEKFYEVLGIESTQTKIKVAIGRNDIDVSRVRK
jgi:hypothetical protein